MVEVDHVPREDQGDRANFQSGKGYAEAMPAAAVSHDKLSGDESEAVYEAQVSGMALLIFWWLSDDENQMHDPVSGKGMVQGLVFMTLLNAAISKWLPGKKARKLACEVRMPCYVRFQEVRSVVVLMGMRTDGIVTVALEAAIRQTSGKRVRLMDAEVELYEKE